jgi:cell division FtsZ-interacting protein ZapD
MFADREPDLNQQIAELERELKKRRQVYPRWIEIGKIDETTADYRIRCLQATIQQLRPIVVGAAQLGVNRDW